MFFKQLNPRRKLAATACLLLASHFAAAHADEPTTPAARLQPLEWMIGEWVGTTSNGVVLVSSHWRDGGNYIVREFLARISDGQQAGATQRIGWDPVRAQIKSWTFDSQGGTGEGYWRRDGDRWLVESTEVTAEGEQVTASASYQPIEPDKFVLEIKCSDLHGKPLPAERIEFQRAKEKQ